jgi:rRNA maturation endonuclease Nob1
MSEELYCLECNKVIEDQPEPTCPECGEELVVIDDSLKPEITEDSIPF